MSDTINHRQKLIQLLTGFFRAHRSNVSLDFLGKWKTKGWEKWWQHELAMHLTHSSQIGHVETEYRVPTVNPRKTSPKYMYFDIALTFKHYSPKHWFLLELKQNDDFRLCIRSMKKDMDKFSTSDDAHLQGLGSIAFAGVIAAYEDDEDIQDYAADLLDEFWQSEGGITIRHIGKHHKLIVV